MGQRESPMDAEIDEREELGLLRIEEMNKAIFSFFKALACESLVWSLTRIESSCWCAVRIVGCGMQRELGRQEVDQKQWVVQTRPPRTIDSH